MKNINPTWFLFIVLSASILCFEVVATRVASVVFVSDFAYIIISLGILGLGGGGWIAHVAGARGIRFVELRSRLFLLLGASYCLFVVAVTLLSITSPLLFFPLLVLPFVLGGMLSARLYSDASGSAFSFYASDLGGAVIGSLLSLWVINMLGATNSVLFLALLAWGGGALSLAERRTWRQSTALSLLIVAAMGVLVYSGKKEMLGAISIGRYPEKDFYYVYSDPSVRARIVDSRWSIFGRADLVAYSHQDMVMQLFVDGAAGSQVYRFNGNVQHTNSNLQGLLLQHTNAIPFLCLADHEKRSMLVIGPGGGKEILLGLFGGARRITGVEVNPDFVAIVKDHRDFNGGIYTDFPNVKIVIDEGRHYVRRMEDSVDLVVMALPSTAQMQNIQPYATNENFLLTREALADYLRILTRDGSLILTVHNPWEMARIIVTAISLFQDVGGPSSEIPNQFVMLESDYAPTVVIRKRAFSLEEARHWQEVSRMVPAEFPRITYLPHGLQGTGPSMLSSFVHRLSQSPGALRAVVQEHPSNISYCTDDSPYFYNMSRWGPRELFWLLGAVILWCALVVTVPLRRKHPRSGGMLTGAVRLPLLIAACAGTGFMILEICLLQRLILWLGEPTTSLAVLLAILLAGMGLGSLLGKLLSGRQPERLFLGALVAIVILGIIQGMVSSSILHLFLRSGFGLRLAIAAMLLLPLAIVLGVPFPLALQKLRDSGNRSLIPWIYAVNCSFAVLGSVVAIVFSLLWGFAVTFLAGIACYLLMVMPAFRMIRWNRVGGEMRRGSE